MGFQLNATPGAAVTISGSVTTAPTFAQLPTGATLKYAHNATASASDQTLFTTTAGKTAYVICAVVGRMNAGAATMEFRNHAGTTLLTCFGATGEGITLVQPGVPFFSVAAAETLKINNGNQLFYVSVIYYEV